jgi:hypothetical protein
MPVALLDSLERAAVERIVKNDVELLLLLLLLSS